MVQTQSFFQLIISIDCEDFIDPIFRSCEEYLKQIIFDGENGDTIKKYFQKMGLDYLNHKITISNLELFQAFISINRKIKGIPSTTNHLESIHGHINGITSRRKCIGSTISKIINFLINTTYNSKKMQVRTLERRF